MSEEQLSALIAKLKDDTVLREGFQGADSLDAAVALARESGFDVNNDDWLNYLSNQSLDIGDEDLESVAGGGGTKYCSNNSEGFGATCTKRNMCEGQLGCDSY
jgi:predicted ribosomally synthesized peptide with nif11-like leader